MCICCERRVGSAGSARQMECWDLGCCLIHYQKAGLPFPLVWVQSLIFFQEFCRASTMWPSWCSVLAWLFLHRLLSSWSLAGSRISPPLSKPNHIFPGAGPFALSIYPCLCPACLASTPPPSWALLSSLSYHFSISFSKLVKSWACMIRSWNSRNPARFCDPWVHCSPENRLAGRG